MANVGPVAWYCRDLPGSAGWSAVTAWATGATIAAGALRRQLAAPAVGSERVFVCIVAGATHATTEPTWVVTKGGKTTDNSVTWQEATGQPGPNGDLTNCPTWLQNKNVAVTLGHIIQNAAGTFLFICTTAGTTGNGAEPTWNTTAGVTTADNTATWTSIGAVGNFGAWAAPFAKLQSAFAANWGAAGHTFYLGDDHAETQTGNPVITAPGTIAAPNNIYSVDHAVSVPPTTLKAGAKVTASAGGISFEGSLYCYGVTIVGGFAGGSQTGLSINAASASQIYDSCLLTIAHTNNYGLTIGSSTQNINKRVELRNTPISTSSTGFGICLQGAIFLWSNTPAALPGAAIPTSLFGNSFTAAAIARITGVDLSAAGSGKTLVSAQVSPIAFSFSNCAFGSGVVVAATPTGDGCVVDAVNCDSAGTSYMFVRTNYRGSQVPETVIVRTGGASNGTTPLSSKLTTTASSLWAAPFNCQSIAIWNSVTGTNRVVTLYGMWNAAALPNNDDVWIDAHYFGSASSPQASVANNTKANNLATGSALTADSTSAWDSLVTARTNSETVAIGAVRKVASNAGRVFFCTAIGTGVLAGSEPGGYASAVDGGSVTDGGATFRAGVRFSMAVTLSSPQPAMAGPIYVTVKAAKVSSTFYVDPLANLS